jgi:membrane protease YdiL (CAAX protease family)
MSFVHRVFYGPAELLAGWRLVIFVVIYAVAMFIELMLLRPVGHLESQELRTIAGTLSALVLLLVAGTLMAKLEGRKMADYGLPWRGSFGKRFWQGALIGFPTITAVVAALHVYGAISFTQGTLQESAVWLYAIAYGLFFVAGALVEEFSCRGYLLFTLTTGIGFWPAAVLSSLFFGLLHTRNPGETLFGCFSTAVFGFLFCMMLRRTGSLWLPVGFHAAYNWGEAFFYGTPDSGILFPQRFLTANLEGPTWLSGGSAGPEGSYLCVAIIVLATIGFGLWQREKKFPDPAALRPKSPTILSTPSREVSAE